MKQAFSTMKMLESMWIISSNIIHINADIVSSTIHREIQHSITTQNSCQNKSQVRL